MAVFGEAENLCCEAANPPALAVGRGQKKQKYHQVSCNSAYRAAPLCRLVLRRERLDEFVLGHAVVQWPRSFHSLFVRHAGAGIHIFPRARVLRQELRAQNAVPDCQRRKAVDELNLFVAAPIRCVRVAIY